MDVLLLIRRYLIRRRIALVAAVFVALSVCSMVVITAVMDGLRSRIHRNVRGTEPDLTFRFKGDVPLDHLDVVTDRLRGEMAANNRDGKLEALSGRLVTVGFAIAKIPQGPGRPTIDTKSAVKIVGIDLLSEADVIPMRKNLDAVDHPDLGSSSFKAIEGEAIPYVLVGKTLAQKLGLSTQIPAPFGRTNTLVLITGQMTHRAGKWELDASNKTFRVAGCFESGRDDIDALQVFVPEGPLHELMFAERQRPDCTTIHARVSDGARNDLESLKSKLAKAHPDLVVQTWQDRNRGLMDALDLEKAMMSLVLGLIVVLTVFLVLGLLYMMVLEKTRDVGVLRSMGFSGKKVILLFFGYGSILGGIGVILGVILGVIVVKNLNPLMDFLGVEVFSSEVPYRFRAIPTLLTAAQVWWIGIWTMALSMASGVIAALRAATIDPLRCLRHE